MARRPHAGVDLGRFTVDITIRTGPYCCGTLLYSSPRPSPLLILSLQRHIPAESLLCLSGGVGERSVVGVGTDAHFPTQTSPSRHRHRPRRLVQDMEAWTSLVDATTPCLHAKVQFPWLRFASGITLSESRGVGKKIDVRSRVDSVFFSGGSEVSRYPGSFDESPGDWHSYPSRTQEAKEGPTHRKVPRFRTGRLAFDG